ncbi:hypothetical protein J5X98_07530 [Leptothermofonsia sichuanensis E412]|uniref:DUF5946 family protein n=1 Tax=Leptothermofonsia sichuanensis TaxID=2917832 RepID=UPI001CA6DC8A|nr:DUF5946 family protein [Leptothermofonsia sichuanensis]QZZ22230.1 hypothetical protein J5X98_07530 [Leptothermofonsia sichuanensis E412]
MTELISCYGCGALVKDIPGESHKYIGASAGCWEVYGEILAKEYGEYGYPETVHRLTVDTYAIQHPGKPSHQSIQSVNTHLISLNLVLEKGLEGAEATQAIRKILDYASEFVWLEPPVPNGRMTVLDVVRAKDFLEHQALVQKWARDVWNAWSVYHHIVRQLVSWCNIA